MPEPRKVEVDFDYACRLLHPRHTVLVTCSNKAGKANIITLAWSTPTSFKPPMVVISIAPRRFSHKMIEETGEFVVNVPTMDIVKETLFCGRISGSACDKFKEAPLTPLPAKRVRSPIIKECVAHLECKVVEKIKTGDHTLFVGEVISAYVNKGIFTETFDVEKVKPVFHMGGDDFATVASEIVSPPRPKKPET
ncbi:MAG TPA: flavin reductase family protein [Candidatus Bathyarchaeia archaeon]|nr:flavin reductase family protein [Candidatus Bathyarchaeia archaeon]